MANKSNVKHSDKKVIEKNKPENAKHHFTSLVKILYILLKI